METHPAGDTVAPPRARSLTRIIREILEAILLALLIYLGVRALLQNYIVESSSMEPNLVPGQYLWVNKAVYAHIDWSVLRGIFTFLPAQNETAIYLFQGPQRGDVVVFHYPPDPTRDYIKRVIGLPGETVEIRAGQVWIDGRALVEPYVREPAQYTMSPRLIGPDEYFVLGDNRNNSSDSHVWGPVPRSLIVGKAWIRYWPLKDIGLAPNQVIRAVYPYSPVTAP
jgi:signal peptidase I